MKTALLSSDSDSNLELLLQLAEKLGMKANLLTEEEAEDLAMVYTIEEGKTGEYIDTDTFLKSLRK